MIGLVGCSAKKLDRAAPARELYTSTLFRLSLADAERECTSVYILSAKHGLIPLDKVISPYDQRFSGAPTGANGAWQWASDVISDLERLHHDQPDVAIYAGAVYADPLLTEFDNQNVLWSGLITTPLHGMQIGERLQWLSRRAAAARARRAA